MANYLIGLHGTISGVEDIFTQTFALVSGATQEAVAQSVVQEFDASFNAVGAEAAPLFSNTVNYLYATAAEILDLGPTDPAVAAATRVDFIAGLAGSGLPLPPQNSIAISFRAGSRPNGTPIRGRTFCPPPSVAALGTNGLVSEADQLNFLNMWTVFMTQLMNESHIPSVWSRTLGSLTPIQTISVGDRVDTIRSRRNAGVENYVSQQI